MWDILYREDGTQDRATSLDGARRKIAERFDRRPIEVGFDDRSSSCGTVEQYDAWLAGCGDRADPVATVTLLEEMPPGWEDRAVERARAEGLFR